MKHLTCMALKKKKIKTKDIEAVAKLTDPEQDLLWHIEHGYQLETDSLGSDPLLRRLANDEVIRPASANRNTVKALEERGLITQGKGKDPLKIVWRATGLNVHGDER
jgi:hypothetical protein